MCLNHQDNVVILVYYLVLNTYDVVCVFPITNSHPLKYLLGTTNVINLFWKLFSTIELISSIGSHYSFSMTLTINNDNNGRHE